MNDRAAYLLTNYRKIYHDYIMMKPEDEEYESAKNYIDKMNQYLRDLEHIPIPETGFLEKSGLTTKQMKLLYFDILTLSYFSETYRSSAEILEFIKKKYGLVITASRLSKVKTFVIDYFAMVLPD